jgi:hypothetical protein
MQDGRAKRWGWLSPATGRCVTNMSAGRASFGPPEAAMPITRLSKGAFTPDEVSFLGRVLELSASANETEEQRERRPLRIIANYMAGRRELTELSRRPLGR